MSTFRAAYIPTVITNSIGILLTLESESHLSDAALRASAMDALRDANDCLASIGEKPYTAEDIVIGEWTE